MTRGRASRDIAAFRVPGDCLIKLHVATWHAGPHFVHDECLFVNLENLDTNRGDFHAVSLDVECCYRLLSGPLFADNSFLMVSPADTSEGPALGEKEQPLCRRKWVS